MTPAQLIIRDQAFAKLQQAVTRFGDKSSQINEHPWREPLLPLATRFGELMVALKDNPDPLADDVATMASLLDDLALPDRDPADDEPGFSEEQAKAAIGNLVYALGKARKALESIGQRPSKPELLNDDEAKVPAFALEDKLVAIATRLESVAADVTGLKRDETGISSSAQQRVLVNFYVRQVEPRIALINTEVSGEIIDMAALARLTEFLATTTLSFEATVAGMITTASAGLKVAAPRLGAGVTEFVGSVRAGAQVAQMWIASRPPDTPPVHPDPLFDIEEVRRLILAGKAIPASWVPQVLELSFFDSELTNIGPLTGLTSLTNLSLMNTLVRDFAPLARLTALTNLSLMNTRVSELAPLAGLTALSSLNLMNTQVSDLAPLASLTALTSLNLWGTQVRDLAPLAGLTALTRLRLRRTKVTDLGPVRKLPALERVYLDTPPSRLKQGWLGWEWDGRRNVLIHTERDRARGEQSRPV